MFIIECLQLKNRIIHYILMKHSMISCRQSLNEIYHRERNHATVWNTPLSCRHVKANAILNISI